MHLRTDALYAAFLLLSLLGGCKRPQPKDPTRTLVLKWPLKLTSSSKQFFRRSGLKPKLLRDTLRRTLISSPDVMLVRGGPHAQRMTLEVGVRGLRPKRTRVSGKILFVRRFQLLIRCQLSPPQTSANIAFEEHASLSLPNRPTYRSFYRPRVLKVLAKQLGQSLRVHAKLRQMSTPTLLKLLTTSTPLARRHAALLLGQRGVRKAIPVLIQMLQEKDQRLLFAALAALTQLKARQAVLPLIRAESQHHSLPLTQKAVAALGVLGGDSAKGYLFTLAGAHPNQGIRRSASATLQALERASTTPSTLRP